MKLVVNTARENVRAACSLVLFVALRDVDLQGIVEARPRRLSDVSRAVVARDLQVERDRVLLQLRRAGVFCIDARPADLSVELINRYLEIQRRELR